MIEQITPDLAARKIIVAAYLYYVLDQPQMSDGEYDQLSLFVAENWDQLHPDRQWALGSPQDVRAGGSHVKFSSIAVGCAYQKLADANIEPRFPPPTDWLWNEQVGSYVTAFSLKEET